MNQGGDVRRTSQKGRRRPGRRHAAAAIWSSVATISVVAAIVTALGDRGRERIAELFDDAPRPAQTAVGVTEDDIDRLSEQLARLRSEMRILGLENNALATKMASMEMRNSPIRSRPPRYPMSQSIRRCSTVGRDRFIRRGRPG
jgi:hypothetical protein